MPRAHERRPVDGQAAPRRAPRPIHDPPESAGVELERLRDALGNAAMSRLLDQRTTETIEANLGGGKPLAAAPGSTRSGADGGGRADAAEVRIHDDTTAADLSRRLGAVAFTYGRDIFLSADAPELGSPAGERMLGHELTHVQQQRTSGITRPRRVSTPGSPAEREAARAADGSAGAATHAPAHTVHREEMPEEEIMTMTSETVHREVAIDEIEAEVASPTTGTPTTATPTGTGTGADAQPATPANPAASALFQVAVTDKIRFASDNLQSDKPDAKAAYEAFREARVALRAVTGTYESSDPQLHAKMLVFGNAMAAVLEMLGPLAGVKRSLPDVAATVPRFVTEAAEIGGLLH
jgi:hypothetical protein